MDMLKWVKGAGSESETKFHAEEPPVSETMIWLCEKCGAKLSRAGADNPSRLLQKELKGLISENKQKGQIRAMVTTCMNVCPSDKIAAGMVDLKSGRTRFFSFALKADTEQLAKEIYRYAGSKP